MIRHEEGKWVLRTRDGSRVLGRHESREKAEAQERAIEFEKKQRGLVHGPD